MPCDVNYLVGVEVEEVGEEADQEEEQGEQEEDPQDHLTLTPPNNQPNKPKMLK